MKLEDNDPRADWFKEYEKHQKIWEENRRQEWVADYKRWIEEEQKKKVEATFDQWLYGGTTTSGTTTGSYTTSSPNYFTAGDVTFRFDGYNYILVENGCKGCGADQPLVELGELKLCKDCLAKIAEGGEDA